MSLAGFAVAIAQTPRGRPRAAAADTPLEIAVQDDGLLLRGRDGLRALAWKRIGELNADYVRVLVPWNDVVSSPRARRRPRASATRLTAFDRLVREARSHGVKVQMTLALSAPAWATSTGRVGQDQPGPQAVRDVRG